MRMTVMSRVSPAASSVGVKMGRTKARKAAGKMGCSDSTKRLENRGPVPIGLENELGIP